MKRFLEEGSRVAVLDHDKEGCRRSEEEAPELSGKITCDVSDPEEVAGLFAFLASEEASYITGHAYVIDGGEIARGLASR